MNTSPLTKAIAAVGLQALARTCGVTYQALRKWEAKGRLPRTEWTGETGYVDKIIEAAAAQGVAITREELLMKWSGSAQKEAA